MLAGGLRANPRPLGLLVLLVAWRPLRPRLSVAFDMRALHPLVPEFPLQLARHDLVLAIIVIRADRRHRLGVHAKPYDMAMLAILLLVNDNDARLPREAKLLFEPVDRFVALRVAEPLGRLRVHRRVIEGPLGAAPRSGGLHLEERRLKVFGGDAAKLFHLHALVGVRAADVIKEPLRAGGGTALVDQGSGPPPCPRPSAAITSARMAAMSARIAASSSRLGGSRPSFKARAI